MVYLLGRQVWTMKREQGVQIVHHELAQYLRHQRQPAHLYERRVSHLTMNCADRVC